MSYICSLSLSLLVGIAVELYARRNVYFSCVPLIRQRVEAVERKLKAQERAIVCGAAQKEKKKKKKGLQSRTTITNDVEQSSGPKPRGQGGAE